MRWSLLLAVGAVFAQALDLPHKKLGLLAQKFGSKLRQRETYRGLITVGGKPFSVLFDTGSGNLLLPSDKCEDAPCKNHHQYAEKKVLKTDMGISFGTGQVEGNLVQDQVCLGSNGGCGELKFVAAHHESEVFNMMEFDGILGLGLEALSLEPGANAIDEVVSTLPTNMFSVMLSEGHSEIVFGGYKRGYMAAEPVWAPLSSQKFWQINSAIGFGGNTNNCDGSCRIAVDTGSTVIAASPDIFAMMQDKISIGDTCNSAEIDAMPDIEFHLSGSGDEAFGSTKKLVIPPSDYIDSKRCMANIVELNALTGADDPHVVVGGPLFRKYLTIFDKKDNRIGFAPQAGGHVGSMLASHVRRSKKMVAEADAEAELVSVTLEKVMSPLKK